LPNKYFIAGAVHDPESDECLEGFTVSLTGENGYESVLQTNDFGDFWFERHTPGTYTLSVAKKRYLNRRVHDIHADEDINVGNIGLCKEASYDLAVFEYHFADMDGGNANHGYSH